jgi:hypothetical protein
MLLAVESDASHLSESRARSRAEGLHYLVPRTPVIELKHLTETNVNAAIEVISVIIPSVVASAFEAEYAALFLNGQTAVGLRQTLADLGYPQSATVIRSDNSCAVGICNRTIKQKRSKSIDMKYHWIRDKVDQGQFKVIWSPGKTNLADYFTKIHPNAHHLLYRKFFVGSTSGREHNNANTRRQVRRKREKILLTSKGVLNLPTQNDSTWKSKRLLHNSDYRNQPKDIGWMM